MAISRGAGPRASASPPNRHGECLLSLSRVLAVGQQGGVLSDALDIVLEGLGCSRGAAYEASGAALHLVVHRALPAEIRAHVERFPLRVANLGEGGVSSRPKAQLPLTGFVVERAAKARRACIEPLLASGDAALDEAELETAGWVAGAAAPIMIGREVLGVIVAAHPSVDPFDKDAMAFLETAANLLGLTLARQRLDEDRSSTTKDHRIMQLAALGSIALGFADDLREPMATLGMLSNEAAERVRTLRPRITGARRDVDALESVLGEMGAALDRAQQIENRLLASVRDSEPEPLHVGDIARDAAALVSSAFATRGVALDAEIASDIVVSGRRAQLTQLFVQLLLNAADACKNPPGRRLGMRVAFAVRSEGGRALVTVDDSGPAITAEARARSGDALVARGGGALGLALAKQVALAHRGNLELSPSSLGGAQYRVSFPTTRWAARSLTPDVTGPSSSPPRMKDTSAYVLWVDDDALFLRSIKRVLKGWDLRIAKSAAEAEAQLAEGAPPLRVFCDVGLPDRAGHELHASIAARAPELARRFVFVTGGAITAPMADYLVTSGCPTLLKPIRVDEVEALLERRADSSRRVGVVNAAPEPEPAPIAPKPKHPATAAASKPTTKFRRARPIPAETTGSPSSRTPGIEAKPASSRRKPGMPNREATAESDRPTTPDRRSPTIPSIPSARARRHD